MQNLADLKDEMEMEMEVNDQLGYPRAYAKLCGNHEMPYSKGPPYTYLPYTLSSHHMEKLKELNKLFPVTLRVDTDPPDTEKYIDVLWKQLDHLGNAGFDPAQFRVDPYGNVLYFHADSASPLSWEVDHWFSRSRGGKTVPSNLRLVQWQVKQVKKNKLEFLVPWWDLQLGVSVNQFLSIFASKNADFRHRAFSYMFFSGKSEQLHEVMVVECHSWPQHFLLKKRNLGLAPAAIVRLKKDKDMDGQLETLNMNRPIKAGATTGKRWAVEEDETFYKEFHKFRSSYPTENEEFEPSFNVRKDKKYSLKEGDWEMKENMGDLYNSKIAFSRAMQKELSLKLKAKEEIRKKHEEISQLDQELKELQKINESERLALEDLEFVLIKHRRRTEKQRRLAETQASYKQCMEKMLRDTMHQNVVYKEQVRLNQAACNALMARLESLKADSDVSERELLKKFKQREDIQELLRPYSETVRKRLREDDTASCMKKNVKKEVCKMRSSCPSAIPGTREKDRESVPLLKHAEAVEETTFLLKNMEENSKRIQKELREFLEEDQEASRAEALKEENARVEEKRGIMMIDGHQKDESVGDNETEIKTRECEAKEDELDDALQLVLTMQHKAAAARAEANAEEEEEEDNEDEDERVRRVGKANLDKWLQMLLQNTEAGALTDEGEGKREVVIIASEIEEEEVEENRGLFGGLLRNLRKDGQNTGDETKHNQVFNSAQVQEGKNTGDKTMGNPSTLKNRRIEIEEKEADDDLGLSQNLRSPKSTHVDAEQNRLAPTAAVNANAGLQKKHRKTSSDAELHNNGYKKKVEMHRGPKHLLQLKGDEECRLKRNGSARRPSSPYLWGAQRKATNALL